jgi:uncharacterized RDD family membrane protein YckC
MSDPNEPGNQPQPSPPQQPTTSPQTPGAAPQYPDGAPQAPTPPQQAPGRFLPPGHPGSPPAEVAPAPTAVVPPGYPQQPVQTLQQPAPKYASFGSRLAALIVDGAIFTTGMLVIGAAFAFLFVALAEGEPDGCSFTDDGCELSDASIGMFFILLGTFFLVYLLAFVLYYIRPVARTGQTLGRKMLNIYVVDESKGTPCGYGRSFLRALIAGLASSSIFYLGYLWVLWDDKNQTWHDKAAGTIVISE